MKTSLVFPVVLAAVASLAGCSGDGSDARPLDGDATSHVAPGTRTSSNPVLSVSREFTPLGNETGSMPIPLGASQYRVALVWGKVAHAHAPSPVAQTWNIEVNLPWGTVDVVSMLPAPGGEMPSVVDRSPGRVKLASAVDAGVEGVILAVVHAGLEPPVLAIGQGTSKDWMQLHLGKLDDEPGGFLPLAHGGSLAWAGFTMAHGCPRGFTLGLWNTVDVPTHGLMFGELLASDGARLGWMTGDWKAGRFPADGSFRADYFDLVGKPGSMSGELGNGTFQGSWAPHGPHNQSGFIHGILGGTAEAGGWLGTWSAVCGL